MILLVLLIGLLAGGAIGYLTCFLQLLNQHNAAARALEQAEATRAEAAALAAREQTTSPDTCGCSHHRSYHARGKGICWWSTDKKSCNCRRFVRMIGV